MLKVIERHGTSEIVKISRMNGETLRYQIHDTRKAPGSEGFVLDITSTLDDARASVGAIYNPPIVHHTTKAQALARDMEARRMRQNPKKK